MWSLAADDLRRRPLLAIFLLAICLIVPFFGVIAVVIGLAIAGISRATGAKSKHLWAWNSKKEITRWLAPNPTKNVITVRDGIQIRTYVIPATGEYSQQPKCMLLACPLGQCGLSIYYPLLMAFEGQYTFVSWDYRGLFSSESPQQIRRLSINEHAEDAIEVLRSAGFSQADVMVGHSMGVQVCLEAALLYPNAIHSLVLLNGSHGHVFQTAFQPIFRIPTLGDGTAALVRLLKRNPHVLGTVRLAVLPYLWFYLRLYCQLFGSKMMKQTMGPFYLYDFFDRYLGKLVERNSTLNYLRLFEELDAHSVYHLLCTINVPCLIVSGLWDTLTPAYLSFEMASALPNCVHYCDGWSSHATLLEHPERVVAEVQKFLDNLPKRSEHQKVVAGSARKRSRKRSQTTAK